MTDSQRKRGRPKAPAKKIYTIRLDAKLAELLDLLVDTVKGVDGSVVQNDMYEAIFHHFFFTMQGKNLRARDTRTLLTLLHDYASYPEKYIDERWQFFNVLSPADVDEIAVRVHSDAAKRQAETAARIAELKRIREAYDTEQQIQLLQALQARVKALEEQQRETAQSKPSSDYGAEEL